MLTNEVSTYGPEHELLLCCARTEADATIIARLREISAATIDWDYLYQLARRHSVLPLVYLQLQRHAADLVPHDRIGRFKQSYQENVARNLVLTSELATLVRAFRDADIESIPYKGPLLALLAYGDLALRRFVDLDIIVKKEDVFRARDVLTEAGYKPAVDFDEHSPLLRTQHNIQFKRDNGRVIVELHWEVASSLFALSVSADDLWQRLVEVELNGENVKSLSADDTLFSLCVHGSRHIWERLSWICDLSELIARHQIDWTTLIDRAVSTDSERMFYLGLFLANRLLGTDLPDVVTSRFAADNHLQVIADRITLRLFSGTTHVPATPGQIFRFNFKLRKSWRGRARYFAFMLQPTDGDIGNLHLPRPLFFAYYLMRPVRLFMFDKRQG